MADNMREQVEKYNQLVQQYHELDEQIDTLLMQYDGHTENMPDEAMRQYRNLARQRDDVFNNMKAMEQTLFVDEDES